jgi:diacylglycerol kinase
MTNNTQQPHHSPNRAASSRYAFAGLFHVLRTQPNARVHALATLSVVAMGLWLQLDAVRWAILVLTIGLVWVAELANTALEAAVDLASPGLHPLAKISKDVAAAAVLVGAITSVIVGLLMLGPPLWAKLVSMFGF